MLKIYENNSEKTAFYHHINIFQKHFLMESVRLKWCGGCNILYFFSFLFFKNSFFFFMPVIYASVALCRSLLPVGEHGLHIKLEYIVPVNIELTGS